MATSIAVGVVVSGVSVRADVGWDGVRCLCGAGVAWGDVGAAWRGARRA